MELAPKGQALGTFDDVEFEQESVGYLPGDKLIMYSDGLFEIKNKNSAYGFATFKDFIKANQNRGGGELAEAVEKELEQFWDGESDRDDMALIVVEFQ